MKTATRRNTEETKKIIEPTKEEVKEVVKEEAPCNCSHGKGSHKRSSTLSEDRRKKMDEDLRMVTGVFKNYEDPHDEVKFSTRRYREEGIQNHKMRDGQRYTIPYYVAKDLAENAGIHVHERYQSTDGKQEYRVGSIIKRYDFFLIGETEDFNRPSGIVTVTR